MRTPVGILEKQTKELLGRFPNTYTFTKMLAERMLKELSPPSLPLSLVRPTIIGASFRDPFPGWIDSLAASAAIFFFTGIGLITQLQGDEDLIGDQVPVDFVADYLLVTGAY